MGTETTGDGVNIPVRHSGPGGREPTIRTGDLRNHKGWGGDDFHRAALRNDSQSHSNRKPHSAIRSEIEAPTESMKSCSVSLVIKIVGLFDRYLASINRVRIWPCQSVPEISWHSSNTSNAQLDNVSKIESSVSGDPDLKVALISVNKSPSTRY